MSLGGKHLNLQGHLTGPVTQILIVVTLPGSQVRNEGSFFCTYLWVILLVLVKSVYFSN